MNPIHFLKGLYRDIEAWYLDRKFHIDGKFKLLPHEIETESCNRIYSKSYGPSYYRSIKTLIREAKSRYPDLTDFYDIGCGLGRVCFYASSTGLFESVSGLDFSQNLIEMAAKSRRKNRLGCWFYTRDAAETQFTLENCLFYFFNPFGVEIWNKFLANNHQCRPVIAYAGSTEAYGVLEKWGFEKEWEDVKWKLSLWRKK